MSQHDNHLLAKIGQYALITNEEGKVLLLQRARSQSWSLPGGRLSKKERDWKEAFVREVMEETGLEITKTEAFDVKIIEDKWQVKYCNFYKCEVKDISNLEISDEHSDHNWVGKEEIDNLDIEDEPKVRGVLYNLLN